MDIEMEGEGEHLYLHLQKSGMNTDELAKLIEKAYNVDSKAVGLGGMKDRHAITSQWFSVTTPEGVELLENLLAEFNTPDKEARVLKSVRHSRKLRHGAHKGNTFSITLRDVKATNSTTPEALVLSVAERIDSIAQSGFPNYIGPQRFGFGGQNLVRARQWFKQPKKRTSRQQRSLWLSSARSALFNIVCAARVRSGNWQNLLAGEPAVLDGSRSFFCTNTDGSSIDKQSDDQSTLDNRVRDFDIHPSDPWWGRGRTPATDASAEFEALQLQPYLALCEALERAGLDQERRALRASANALEYRWVAENALELKFSLSPGVFATSLLRELTRVTEPQR